MFWDLPETSEVTRCLMLTDSKRGVNANVDNPETLTTSKEMWSGGVILKGFCATIFGMTLESKSPGNRDSGSSSVDRRIMRVVRDSATDANFEVLEPNGVSREKRKTELMGMGRQDLQRAAQILPLKDRLASKNDLVKRILDAEMGSSDIKETSSPQEEEVKDSEPQVNDQAERALEEATLREKIKANFPNADSPKPASVSIERKRIVYGGELLSKDPAYYYSRRGMGDLAPKEDLKTELASKAALRESKTVPSAKSVKPEVVPITVNPADRPKLITKEQLGRKPEVISDEAAQIENIAQKLFKNELLTSSEERFKDDHPEVLKRLREFLQGTHPEEFERPEAAVAKPVQAEAEAVLGKNLPAVANSTEVATTGAPKKGVDELVGFHLGKLGIKPEEILQQFPEFLNLSKNQQIYTIKKLEQKANRDLDRESTSKLDENDKANKKGGWFGRVGRSLTKGSRLSMLRSKMDGENKAGGLGSYKERLQDLTALVERRGISIEPGEGGQMVLQFLAHEANEDPKRAKLIEDFNLKASKVADVPYDWTVDHATPALKAQYKLIQRSFEKARQALVAYESKTVAEEKLGEKLLEINNVDSEIEMSQFLNHNTGIVGKVNQFIKNNRYLEGKIGMAIGMGARELGKNAIVFGGGIVAAAVTGGFTSWFRKRAELRKLEEDQRAGINIGEEKGKTVKKSIDIVNYTKKINQLTEHAAKATGDAKQRTLETLQTRIAIVQDRIKNLGVVNFGGGRNELVNQYEFTRAIKEANRVLMEATPVPDQVASDVYDRFDKKYLQDEEKSAERKKQLIKAFERGALIGGGASVLGYVGMDLALHKGEGVAAAWRDVESHVYAANEYMSGGFDPENVPLDKTDAVRTINPTPATAGQSVNFPGNIPRPDSLPYGADQIVIPPPTPVAESFVGARGAIGAIKDLQRALIDQYGGNMPENLKSFVDANPDRLAIKWNMFKPEFRDESIALPRGTKFLALPDGNISLKLPDGKFLGITNPTENMKFDYFDSGARAAAPTVPNNLDQNIVQSSGLNPGNTGEGLAGGASELNSVDNSQDLAGAAENAVPREGYTFEKAKNAFEGLGFRHEAVPGGDIFSAEVATDAAAGPQMVEGYTNIDGLNVDTKELKGTVDFLYDSKGQIKGLDLPKLQVADVARFRATPEQFIGGDHHAPERFELTKKLLTVRSEVETYLNYRRIMEIKSLNPGSDEYRFLNSESNRLWTAIQKKVEYQFTPQYSGFNANPIENTAPVVEVPPGGVPTPAETIITPPEAGSSANEGILGTETDQPEIVRTNRDVIPADSILLKEDFASQYGGVERVDKNVIFFKDGHVGFYAESMKQGVAERSARTLASANAENLGINMNRPPVPVATQVPGGPVRYLSIYEKVK